MRRNHESISKEIILHQFQQPSGATYSQEQCESDDLQWPSRLVMIVTFKSHDFRSKSLMILNSKRRISVFKLDTSIFNDWKWSCERSFLALVHGISFTKNDISEKSCFIWHQTYAWKGEDYGPGLQCFESSKILKF